MLNLEEKKTIIGSLNKSGNLSRMASFKAAENGLLKSVNETYRRKQKSRKSKEIMNIEKKINEPKKTN